MDAKNSQPKNASKRESSSRSIIMSVPASRRRRSPASSASSGSIALEEIAYDPDRDRLSGFVMSDALADPATPHPRGSLLAEAVRWISRAASAVRADEIHAAQDVPPSRGGGDADAPPFGPQRSAPRRRARDPRPAVASSGSASICIRPIRASGWRRPRCFPHLRGPGEEIEASSIPPPITWTYRTGRQVLRVVRHFGELSSGSSTYDDFMLSFANHLKLSDEIQDRSPRKTWQLVPGSAWLAFTDGLLHAELRGRCVLDHVFLVPPTAWVRPETAPRTLIAASSMTAAAA